LIIENITEISYFMRGSISYEHLMMRVSVGEREIIENFLKKRIKAEMKSPHPNY